jgi:hypothetical protein
VDLCEEPRCPTSSLALNVFLPIVDLRQEKNWWPEVGTRYGRWLRMFLWVEIILGWFFSILLVAASTGLIQKT